jgi:hypothetical protein
MVKPVFLSGTLTMVVGSKYIYTHLANRTHMFLCFVYSNIIYILGLCPCVATGNI